MRLGGCDRRTVALRVLPLLVREVLLCFLFLLIELGLVNLVVFLFGRLGTRHKFLRLLVRRVNLLIVLHGSLLGFKRSLAFLDMIVEHLLVLVGGICSGVLLGVIDVLLHFIFVKLLLLQLLFSILTLFDIGRLVAGGVVLHLLQLTHAGLERLDIFLGLL